MWRSILMVKLTVSIVASLVVGAICVSWPWRADEIDWRQSGNWIAAGSFFLVFAVAQLLAIYFLTRRKV